MGRPPPRTQGRGIDAAAFLVPAPHTDSSYPLEVTFIS